MKELTQEVYELLQKYPYTRNSDRMLYREMLTKRGKVHMSAFDVLTSKDVPNYESVGRCRRKLQATFPELKPVKEVAEKRKEKEEEFIQYSIEEVLVHDI